MSVRATAEVWATADAKGSELLLLLALADYAHDDGTHAFPSVPTLAAKMRMSERSVQRALRKLEDGGQIEPTGTHRSGTTVYRLRCGSYADGGDKMTPPGGGVKMTGGDVGVTGGGDAGVTGGVTQVSPEPSGNHQGEPSRAAAAARVREVLGSLNRRCAAPAVVAEAEAVVGGTHPVFAADGDGLRDLATKALHCGMTGAVPHAARAALAPLDGPARAAVLVAVLRTGRAKSTEGRTDYLLSLATQIPSDDARRTFTAEHGDAPAPDRPSGRPRGTAAERASTRTVAGMVALLDKYPEHGPGPGSGDGARVDLPALRGPDPLG